MEAQSAKGGLELRPAAEVMRLDRLGSFHQSRLSFMRAVLRMLGDGQWTFGRSRWDVDEKGVGVAIYTASLGERIYSLVCFAHDLPAELRSDRVIAEAWDATFSLFDGVPDERDIERLSKNTPYQEAGRFSEQELVLARANRSVRLFNHVVERLSLGQQPDPGMIDDVGYLMRTTAVYGNGKFGISDRERIRDRPEFCSAFHTELLAVWLIRWFTLDIVEHMASMAGGEQAATMERQLARRLGVGNSTGLGMAPFLILHPSLIHSWIAARETALVRVRALSQSSESTRAIFSELVSRSMLGVESWRTVDSCQADRNTVLKKDLLKIARYTHSPGLQGDRPWDQMIRWSSDNLSLEGQELLVSLVIEPHGELVDDLAHTMAVDEVQHFPIDGAQSVDELIGQIETLYDWALELDFNDPFQCARFWYYSEEKLEPRLGERNQEPGAEREHPLAYGRDVSELYAALGRYREEEPSAFHLAEFLLCHPRHRHAARRVQLASKLCYAEIRDNLLAGDVRPIDLLRCKLSFFGASKFDPRSDRWVRINMYQYAPYPDEPLGAQCDLWVYPPLDTGQPG